MKLSYEVKKNSDGKKLGMGRIKTMTKAVINSNNELCNSCKMIVLDKTLLPMKSATMHELLMNIFGKVYNVILAEVSRDYSIDKDDLSIEFKVLKLSRKEAKLMIKSYYHIKRDLERNDLQDREQ